MIKKVFKFWNNGRISDVEGLAKMLEAERLDLMLDAKGTCLMAAQTIAEIFADLDLYKEETMLFGSLEVLESMSPSKERDEKINDVQRELCRYMHGVDREPGQLIWDGKKFTLRK